MNSTGNSHFNQAHIEWAIRLRYSPLPELDMTILTSQLNAFRIGELRVVGKTWEVMHERDAELAVNSDKRKADAAGLDWQIVSDGSLAGDRHAAALQYFYEHLTATRALDQDSTGGTDELVYQVLSSLDYYYSAHEMLLRVDNAAAREVTCEFRHTPIWFLEARRGYLGYLQHIFDLYGQPCINGEWLTAVNQGWLRPLSLIFALKQYALRDWGLFNTRYGSGFLDAQTSAQAGTPEWEQAMTALRSLAGDGAVLHNESVSFKFLEQAGRNALPFEPMVQWCNSLYAKCYRGVDLATSSRNGQTGASGPTATKALGASIQKEEYGIFLGRDAKWVTGVFNERIDRPILRYLFGQEPRAWFALMPPLNDTNSEDLQAIQALVPMGLKIALKEVYKRFRWSVPADNDPCLTPPAQAVPAPNGEDHEPALDEDGNPIPAKTTTAPPNPKAPLLPPEENPEPDGKTCAAMSDETTPIAPGADPKRNPGLATPSGKAYLQSASRQMPDTQVDAAGFWSRAGQSGTPPSLGYAVPNQRDAGPDWLAHLTAVGLANSRAAQSLRRSLREGQRERERIALANAEKDVPEKIADELRAIIAKMIAPALAEKFIAGLQGKAPLANAFDPGQSRDQDGKWSAAAAQASGEAAMKKVLAEKKDVFTAMHRPELGDVDFRYGNDKGGIAHVVAEHDEATAQKIPQMIAHGEVIHGQSRAYVEHEGNRLVLAKDYYGKPSNHWVILAYEKRGK